MTRIKRILALSCAVILLCFSAIVGATYAIFTDSVTQNFHLQSGTLDIDLVRLSYTRAVVDAEGYIATKSDSTVTDFSQAPNENAFGLDGGEALIIPGCYFEAKMQIVNKGNVAVNYTVNVRLGNTDTELSEQMVVIVKDAAGNEVARKNFSEMTDGKLLVSGGQLTAAGTTTPSSDVFTVHVEFENLDTDGSINNKAQTQTLDFDLYVSAVQAGAK